MSEGFTSNYVKGGVLFAKASSGGRALKEIKERGGGSGHNCPSSSPFSRPEQGRGALGAGGLGPAALELGGGLRRGKKEPGGAGDRFPPSIPEEGARNGGAMAASGGLRPACAAAVLRGSNGGRG